MELYHVLGQKQNMIQEIWDNIEVEPYVDPDAGEEKPVVKKKKTLTVKLDYKRT